MGQENDIQSFRRLLNEIAEMCEHASLTGSLSGGAKRTAQRYNAVLRHLVDSDQLPQGLFSEIPEDSSFGEIGVEAKMLAGYFPSNRDRGKSRDDGENNILLRLAPFVGKEELALLIREQAGKGMGLDINMLSNLAPFLGQDTLGEMIRAHLSKDRSQKEATPPATPATPSTPAAPSNPDYRLEPVKAEKESVEELLNLMKSPYLSDEERNNLVDKLRAATGR